MASSNPQQLSLNFDPSVLILPTVPNEEEDPRVRINVMIQIFNENLRPEGPVDDGFLHEIWTAAQLLYDGRIKTGSQISRPLTTKEKSSGRVKGTSQMILAPGADGRYREIDMLCDVQGIPYIVEAKHKVKSDFSQLKANVILAQQLRGGVMYAFGGVSERKGQEKALREAYGRLPETQSLPPLEVAHVKISAGDVHNGKCYGDLFPIITRDQELLRQELEDAFNEYKIPFSDLGDWKKLLEEADKKWGERPKYSGWAKSALEE